MVEIEIGVLASQCLDRRIQSYADLVTETAAWEEQRNAARARVNWSFTTEKARAPKWVAPIRKPTNPTRPQKRVKTSVPRYLVPNRARGSSLSDMAPYLVTAEGRSSSTR